MDSPSISPVRPKPFESQFTHLKFLKENLKLYKSAAGV